MNGLHLVHHTEHVAVISCISNFRIIETNSENIYITFFIIDAHFGTGTGYQKTYSYYVLTALNYFCTINL